MHEDEPYLTLEFGAFLFLESGVQHFVDLGHISGPEAADYQVGWKEHVFLGLHWLSQGALVSLYIYCWLALLWQWHMKQTSRQDRMVASHHTTQLTTNGGMWLVKFID